MNHHSRLVMIDEFALTMEVHQVMEVMKCLIVLMLLMLVSVGVSLYVLSVGEISYKFMDFTFDMYFR